MNKQFFMIIFLASCVVFNVSAFNTERNGLNKVYVTLAAYVNPEDCTEDENGNLNCVSAVSQAKEIEQFLAYFIRRVHDKKTGAANQHPSQDEKPFDQTPQNPSSDSIAPEAALESSTESTESQTTSE